MAQNTKACPFCGEQIIAGAIKCKHCGSGLNAAGVAAPDPLAEASRSHAPAQPYGFTHTPALQILGIVVITLALAAATASGRGWLLMFAIVADLVFIDAWISGIRKRTGERAFTNMSPLAWAVFAPSVVGMAIYAASRKRLRTTRSTNTAFVLAIVVLCVTVLVIVVPAKPKAPSATGNRTTLSNATPTTSAPLSPQPTKAPLPGIAPPSRPPPAVAPPGSSPSDNPESAQELMSNALNAKDAGDFQRSFEILNDLVVRFPTSPLVRDARQRIRELNKAIAAQAEKEKADLAAVEKLIRKAPPSESLAALDAFEKSHRAGALKERVATLRADLKTTVEAEQKATETLAKLGLEIANFQSYWAVDANVLGGEAILAPFLRFKVKNLLQVPITDLEFSATFDLVDKKEQLGSGDTDVVSASNPLKPGYSKEVFFGSGTGYGGPGAAYGRPNVSADLYVQVNDGPKTLVKQLRVANKLR